VDYQLRQMFKAIDAPDRYLRIHAELHADAFDAFAKLLVQNS
jgi:hypothetical protein